MTDQFTQVPAYSQRVETTTAVAVAGQQAFFAGRDAYLDPACILDVLVDGAPAAFVPMERQKGGAGTGPWPQASTANIARGIYLATPCAGGETVSLTYAVRTLHVPAPVPCPVYAPGGVLPSPTNPNEWARFAYTGPNVPDALLVPMIAGLQVEVWRKTHKTSSVRKSSLGTIDTVRSGRHFSPWWRTPVAGATETIVVNPFTSGWTAFTASQRKRLYRLAYFDPASGARSLLSDQTIFIAMTGNGDRIGGVLHHPAPSVWVGR